MEILILGFFCIALLPIGFCLFSKYKKRQNMKAIERQRFLDAKEQEHRRERERAEYEKLCQLERAKKEEFHSRVYPISTSDEEIKAEWKKWDYSSHDDEQQLQRQERSLYNVTPLLIDSNARLGYFLSSDGASIYETHLSTCSCPDFERRNLPCKHIYRLFYDLNHQENIIPGMKDIPDGVYSAFQKMSSSAKLYFVQYGVHIPDNGRTCTVDASWRAEIRSKLVKKSEPDIESYVPLINAKTKDQIFDALKTFEIEGYRQSWTKERLINWIKTEQPDFLKKYFIDYGFLTLPPEVIPWARSIVKAKILFRPFPLGERYWVHY